MFRHSTAKKTSRSGEPQTLQFHAIPSTQRGGNAEKDSENFDVIQQRGPRSHQSTAYRLRSGLMKANASAAFPEFCGHHGFCGVLLPDAFKVKPTFPDEMSGPRRYLKQHGQQSQPLFLLAFSLNMQRWQNIYIFLSPFMNSAFRLKTPGGAAASAPWCGQRNTS